VDYEIIIQILIGGVLMGGLYALVAFGLSLIYGVARVLNFAHGTLLAVCGIAAAVMFATLGWHPAILALILAPIFFVFGFGYYIALLAPLKRRNHFEATIGTVLVTVGTLIIVSDVAAALAGPNPRNIRLPFAAIEVGEIVVSLTQLYILAGIVALTFALHVVLTRTWFGRAVRAVTQDAFGAAICGVASARIHALTFGLGFAIVAIAGILYAMNFPVDPYSGFNLTVKAFTIIVLGGIGSLPGSLVAGILLGSAEAFTAFYWAPEWAPALSIVLLLVILVVAPGGFAGWKRT